MVRNFLLPMSFLLVWLAGCAMPYKTSETGGVTDQPSAPPADAPEPSEPSALAAALPTIPYSIQVGAFSTVERAAAYAETLRRSGLETYHFVDRDGLYKVRIERFDTREAAQLRATALRDSGLIDQFFIAAPLPAKAPAERPAAIRDGLLQTAQRFIGTPYRWGGASAAEGFDCSGLTRTVYRLNGLELPRSAHEQYRLGTAVQRAQIKIGDLLFFDTRRSGRVSHVGIYCGQDSFIHAPGEGKSVRAASLSNGYFAKRYLGARRYF